MEYFVPCSEEFKAAVRTRRAPGCWRILIETAGDGLLEDVTGLLHNNNISGTGKRSGAFFESVSNSYKVVLRNPGGLYREGDFAGAKCAVEARVGDAEYIRIFTGFVSKNGASRSRSRLTNDTVILQMYDYSKMGSTQKKSGIFHFVNLKICDPADTGQSIFHQLAYDMGLSDEEIEVLGEIDLTKDYLSIDGANTNWKEINELTAAYLGLQTFRYDGKLRFISRFMQNWTDPEPEWIFDDDNIYDFRATGGKVLVNYTWTEFSQYEVLEERTIHKCMEKYLALFKYNNISVAPGEYWPGEYVEGSVATLKYMDPKTGVEWDLGINIVTPTIGDYGSGADIECEGGFMSLHSFNGIAGTRPELTSRKPDASRIILKNETGNIIYIRKLTFRGQPVKILADKQVDDNQNPGLEEWEIVEKQIPGKYMVNETQAANTCRWWVDFGKNPRRKYNIITGWLPQIQEGALVTVNSPSIGINGNFIVQSYQHQSKGSMAKTTTKIELIEDFIFAISGEPVKPRETMYTGVPEVAEQDIIKEDIGERPTYREMQEGYTRDGGVEEPNQAVIQECKPVGISNIFLLWDSQLNLTNLSHHELQVSDDGENWYSLQFDGSDWKDQLGGLTVVYGNYITHVNIPFSGDIENPAGRTLFYRVRRVTKKAVNGSWSDIKSTITKLISNGDVGAGAIFANNMVAGFLNTIFATVNEYLLVTENDGMMGQTYVGEDPPSGAQRARLDRNELTIQRWDGSAWEIIVKCGGDENGGFFPYVQAHGLIKTGQAKEVESYDIGDRMPDFSSELFRFDDNTEDLDGRNPWHDVANIAYTPDSLFKGKALTAGSTDGYIRDDDAGGMMFKDPFSINWYTYLSSVNIFEQLLFKFSTRSSLIFKGEDSSYNTGITYGQDIAVIDSKHFCVFFRNLLGFSYTGKAVIGEVHGTDITWGAEYLVIDQLPYSYIEEVSCCLLDADHIVFVWNSAANPHQGFLRIGTISNINELSFGPVYNINDTAFETLRMPCVKRLSDDRFIIGYYHNITSGDQVLCRICTVDISYNVIIGDSHQCSGMNDAYLSLNIGVLEENKIVLSNGRNELAVGDITDMDISYSDIYFCDTQTPADWGHIDALDSGHFIMVYSTSLTGGDVKIKIGSVTGSSIDMSPSVLVQTDLTNSPYPRVWKVDRRTFLLIYQYGLPEDNGKMFYGFLDESFQFSHWSNLLGLKNFNSSYKPVAGALDEYRSVVLNIESSTSDGLSFILPLRRSVIEQYVGNDQLTFRFYNQENELEILREFPVAPLAWHHCSVHLDTEANALFFTVDEKESVIPLNEISIPLSAVCEIIFYLLSGAGETRMDDLLIKRDSNTPDSARAMEHYRTGQPWTREIDHIKDLILVPGKGGQVAGPITARYAP